jgi:ABC-type dipeptide/oligopeptide/nickel transport system ATPase subunit
MMGSSGSGKTLLSKVTTGVEQESDWEVRQAMSFDQYTAHDSMIGQGRCTELLRVASVTANHD